MSNAAVSVGTAATLIIAKNFRRVGLVIDNTSASTIYLGDSASVTTANGTSLDTTDKWIEYPSTGEGSFYYKGAYYGICATTSTVRVMEVESTK